MKQNPYHLTGLTKAVTSSDISFSHVATDKFHDPRVFNDPVIDRQLRADFGPAVAL
jgi:hypothetical protein